MANKGEKARHVSSTYAEIPAPPPTYEEAITTQDGGDGLPKSSEVIAHLKLLFAFSKLRERVLNDPCLFGIDESWLPYSRTEDDKDITKCREIISEKRWDIYVKRAALRFESWWCTLKDELNGRKLAVKDLILPPPGTIKDLMKPTNSMNLTDRLPPLDVLMVWHSFILSPRKYLECCLLDGRLCHNDVMCQLT